MGYRFFMLFLFFFGLSYADWIRLYYYNSSDSIWNFDYDLTINKVIRISQISLKDTLYPQIDVDGTNVYASSEIGNTIYSVSHSSCTVNKISTKSPVGNIAVDCTRKYIYHTSNGGFQLNRINYDGTNFVNISSYNQAISNVVTNPAQNTLYYFYNMGITILNFAVNSVMNVSRIPNFCEFSVDPKTGDFYYGYGYTESFYNFGSMSYFSLFSVPQTSYILSTVQEPKSGLLFLDVGHTTDKLYDVLLVPITSPSSVPTSNVTITKIITGLSTSISSLRPVYCTPATCGVCGTNIFNLVPVSLGMIPELSVWLYFVCLILFLFY